MTEPKTRTLEVPGAVLTYDVRTNEASAEPTLLLIASPMGAGGLVTLAGHFADRTVVTYDPRGVDRSRRTDDATESTPEEHADDLSRLIAALGREPVDLFRAASTKIVMAAGAASEGELAHRGAEAVAERLGHDRGHLPRRPCRIHGRRVRPDGRARRLRREAAQGHHCRGITRSSPAPVAAFMRVGRDR